MITLRLSPNSGVPIYRQIQDQIRYGIASGLLRAGEQLPTVRALAVELAVNPNTVIKAYSELEREGVLTTEQGSGTFVAAQPVIALSQLSRSTEQRNPPIPILSDLRDSGGIEQDSDIVLMLYRQEMYNEDCDSPGETDVYVRKNRNGPTGESQLTAKPVETRMSVALILSPGPQTLPASMKPPRRTFFSL